MTGIILLATAIGAIWAAVFIMRMPLLLAALATVLAGAVWGCGIPSLRLFSIGTTRWTIDRAMLLFLIAAFVVQRQQGRTLRKALGASEWLMLVFVGWITVSVFTHDFWLMYGHTATPLWRWATAYCIPMMLYLIARQSSYGQREVDWMYWALILFGVYLAVTGIFEIMHLWTLVFPKHIADPTVGIHFGRARGPMVTSVTYGLYLGVSLLCLWATRERLGRLAWLIVPPISLLFCVGLYYSYTRSSWLGTGLGLLLILAYSMHGRARILTVGSLALCAVLMLTTKMDRILSFQREQSGSVAKDSAECRLIFAYVSWKMFEDAPIWGAGFGQFPVAKMPYLSERVDMPLEEIRPLVHHNTFLSLLSETGIVGLVLFVAILISWARHAQLLCRDPALPPWIRRHAVLFLGVLGLYVCQLVFHELSYSTMDNCLVFLLAGTLMGAHPGWMGSKAPATNVVSDLEPDFSSGIVRQRNLGLT
jgi:O-antigen ligase